MSVLQHLKQHFDVLRAAISMDHEQQKSKRLNSSRRRTELAFLPAALEIMETPPSPLGRTLAWVIVIFFSIALTWATFGEMDIIATAQGRIIPSSRVKVVQPLEAGIVRAIYVSDGQSVRGGDILMQLDPTGAQADQDRLANEILSLKRDEARLTALIRTDPIASYYPPHNTPAHLIEHDLSYLRSQLTEHRANLASRDSEIAKRSAEIRTIEAEISRIRKILPNVRERVAGRKELLEQQIVARLNYLELEQQLIELEGQLAIHSERLQEARSALDTSRAQREQVAAEFQRTALAQLSNMQKQIQSLDQDLIKAQERNRLQTLIATEDGVVQQLAVHTIGGVVVPAQQLMVIVPANSQIEIEAMILNKDVGFVSVGHPTEIKIESFPFTRYGTIQGSVVNVSRDAIQDDKLGLIYPARISIDQSHILVGDQYVLLSPGMAATVEIKTGKRKMIEYLLAPLQRYRSESMRER